MNDYFASIRQTLQSWPEEKPVDCTLYATSSTFLASMVERLRNSLPGPELDAYVSANMERFFQILLDHSMDTDPANFAQITWLLNNLDFVAALVNVIGTMKDIDPRYVTLCNSLYYDYATQTGREPDKKLLGAYMMLTKVVNKKKIMALTGVGVPTDIAANLAAAVYSSTNDEVAIRRMNWVIVQAGPGIMTIPTICGIYETLIRSISKLFVYTMLDAYDDPVGMDQSALAAFDQVNSNIDVALLTELNETPMDFITESLYKYASTYTWRIRNGARFRFRIMAINNAQYGRILKGIELIQPQLSVNGLTLP